MKFSIITPTHKRPEQLSRCVNSVLSQTSFGFQVEMIIINDSPDCDYSLFENDKDIIKAITEEKIIYIKNKENKGKNYSCNLALTKVTGNYVIFLDDDDWLASKALSEIYTSLSSYKLMIKWLVTNRVYDSGKVITTNNKGSSLINYFWDCMIFKRFYGDATHIVESNMAKQAHFNKKIKNGKEWYYFAQLCPTFIYRNLNTTITSGYQDLGLTQNLKHQNKFNKIKETIYNVIILFTLRLKICKKKI